MPIAINGSGSITGVTDFDNSSVGRILQVVSTTKTDSFDTSSTSFVDVTGLSVSITPASTDNKILVLVHMMVGANWWSEIPGINLVRDSTNICQSTGGSTYNATAIPVNYADGAPNSSDMINPQSIVFLDSPATTSSTTYKIQVEQMAVNRKKSGASTGGTSTITVMEVAG